jgi:hypothetical protein
MSTYTTEPSQTFEGALLQVIEQFRRENPSIGAYNATLHDGSTVILWFRNKPARKRAKKP